MAKKKASSRSTLTILLTIAIVVIAVLGALGYVDTVALDDVLEPFLGVRPFLTEPLTVDLPAEDAAGTPVEEVSASGDWWSVYFTNPGGVGNPIEDELIALIDNAQSTIHIASFEFNLDAVAEALIAAHERGVEVQWVTDDEHGIDADEEEDHGQFEMLDDAGIEVKDDHRGDLMHNKFWIFDGQITWTGSTNITVNGTLKNNNNVMVVESPALAEIYEREFQEMWTGDEFGPRSTSTANQQSVVIDGTAIQVLFAPEDEVGTYLAELLGRAQSEIRFMAFSFTHDDMGGTMLSRSRAGVDVSGIFEVRGSETEYSELPALYCEGLPVRQDGNPRTFHHKVLVIDRQIVVTGSFNFSASADEGNDENVIIINNAEIAAEYLKEFDRRWAEAQEPDAADISCP
ncbi:MAG TPA: phospholipase D-like domain-containing protein [Anaerolineales bacterium]|nr:phospholipase D-like domain-containing protein [Anaerolineales bacterium]